MDNPKLLEFLGGDIPAGIVELDGKSQDELAILLVESQRRQRSQLKLALEGALGHVPRMLRGTVRKVLFP